MKSILCGLFCVGVCGMFCGAQPREDGVIVIEIVRIPVVQYAVLAAPALDSKGTSTRLLALIGRWKEMYGKVVDPVDAAGNKIIPAPGSFLALERKSVIKAIDAGGDYNALWNAYTNHLNAAVSRRARFSRGSELNRKGEQ